MQSKLLISRRRDVQFRIRNLRFRYCNDPAIRLVGRGLWIRANRNHHIVHVTAATEEDTHQRFVIVADSRSSRVCSRVHQPEMSQRIDHRIDSHGGAGTARQERTS